MVNKEYQIRPNQDFQQISKFAMMICAHIFFFSDFSASFPNISHIVDFAGDYVNGIVYFTCHITGNICGGEDFVSINLECWGTGRLVVGEMADITGCRGVRSIHSDRRI